MRHDAPVQPSRLENLSTLFAALISVCLTGQLPALQSQSGSRVRFTPPFSPMEIQEFSQGGRYFGAYSRVARRLAVSKASVASTAKGEFRSPRIVAALLEEVRAIRVGIEAEPTYDANDCIPISEAEVAELRVGGKYAGVLSQVARDLHVNPKTVRCACEGSKRNPRVLAGLRREIRRVDTALASDSCLPLTVSERALFQYGGPYYGLLSRIARREEVTVDSLSKVVRGKTANPASVRLIRQEMAGVHSQKVNEDGGSVD